MLIRNTMDAELGDFLGTLPSNVKSAAARFALEYHATPELFSRMGVTEQSYVRSRLVDEGLAVLSIGEKRGDYSQPAHERIPGLISPTPSPNQVGSPV